jgi:hypothetical protein
LAILRKRNDRLEKLQGVSHRLDVTKSMLRRASNPACTARARSIICDFCENGTGDATRVYYCSTYDRTRGIGGTGNRRESWMKPAEFRPSAIARAYN